MTRAITGELSITTDNGTVLTDSTDLGLAWKWAEHERGTEWQGMTWLARNISVAHALHALREAYHQGS